MKPDLGVVPPAGTLGETTTQGLDNFAQRAAVSRRMWFRKVALCIELNIGPHTPSHLGIFGNANVVARSLSKCWLTSKRPGLIITSTSRVSHEEIGLATVTALRREIPAIVPSITFLSGDNPYWMQRYK
ncbi:hypothetical protein OSTOST_16949 [Ostertagia ostertagi]